MTPSTIARCCAVLALGLLLLPTPGTAQTRLPGSTRPPPAPLTVRPTETPNGGGPPVPFTPKFEAIAETRLLMEGMLHANYRSLQKHLKTKPADRDTWVFARGQAILVAEAGNLLLLRPPRGSARDTWMKLAMDMRTQAKTLARAAATKDYQGSVQGLADLSTACKNCHSTFRIGAKIDPEPAVGETDAE